MCVLPPCRAEVEVADAVVQEVAEEVIFCREAAAIFVAVMSCRENDPYDDPYKQELIVYHTTSV